MNAHKHIESHFSTHWLPWLALYHFLPACDLREVVSGMVDSMSSGRLTLNELFHEQMCGSGAVSETWVIAPKPVDGPLATYLQNRIRALVWSNDASAFFDPNAEWADIPVHPSLIEAVVRFASYPDNDLATRQHPSYSLAEHPELVALTQCISALSSPANSENASMQAQNALISLDMPLRAAALKFAGDYAALEDAWRAAATLYERVLDLLSAEEQPPSVHLSAALTTVTAQSLANASRVLGGKEHAAAIFDSAQQQWPSIDSILFAANASHESLQVHTTEKHWPYDNRTALLRAPLLIGSHDVEAPILDFLASEFSQANDMFHSRLRRQIALGSGGETRVTKAIYARSIFSSLAAELQARRNKAAFCIATCFLIESGNPKLASSIDWNKELVEVYVDDQLIQLVHERSSAFDGVRAERRLVAIELLTSWATQLPSESSGIASTILRQLASFAEANEATSNPSTNIAGRSLKALKQIGAIQPEWLRPVSKPIADAIVARLNAPGWWTGMQEAVEAAITCANAFESADLASVVLAAVGTLEHIDPSFWLVVRPLHELITSKRVCEFIRTDKDLERKVVELLLRQATSQDGDHANLIHSLRAFDAGLLRDPRLKIRLDNAMKDIKKKAEMVNNSASPIHIQALLGLPAISGLDGVKIALASLGEILKSAASFRYNVSLAIAYYPLLQISSEHDEIAKGIGISNEEFLTMLEPLNSLVKDLWRHAAEDPKLFASFSIPPKQVPNPVTVHNWTFVSIQFAQLFGDVAAVEAAIDSAARAQPSIQKAVARAKAIKALSAGEEIFDEEKVKSDGKDAFYLSIGSRLSQVDASTDEGRARCRLLLQMCLQHGPTELDMAIFVQAHQCGISLADCQPEAVATYMRRLETNPDRHLNFLPVLKQLGYKQELH